MQAVADALSLLANILMAWNTAQMQQVLDHWAQRRDGAIPPELIGRIAPTRTEGINLRGVFRGAETSPAVVSLTGAIISYEDESMAKARMLLVFLVWQRLTACQAVSAWETNRAFSP
jgi:Tn3 transposase DDE domain